jgi:hypothetical protein
MVPTISIEENAGAEQAINEERWASLEEISLLIERS